MNIQPPEKPSTSVDGSLKVHSIFKTIQGEGPFTGQRAIFVRLWGCNLQCPLCDTEYTSHGGLMAPNELVKAVEHAATPNLPDWAASEMATALRVEINMGYLVVITGGEPFRQNLRPAIEALLEDGFGVQLETNGTLYQDLPYEDIIVVCSPKTGSINKDLVPHIQTLKYVICSEDVSDVDGLPMSALKHPCGGRLARPPVGFQGMVLVQPADEGDEGKNRENLNTTVNSVMEFGYTLQLQNHKLIGVP